jgi:hypothetical protein
MRRERRLRLRQQDLRAMGASPGRMLTRYSPDGERAEVRQLTAESRPRPPASSEAGPEPTNVRLRQESEG